MSTSGFFPTTVVGMLRAAGQVEQWDRNAIDPTGFRHHESGEYRPDAKKLVALCGGFTAQMESGVAINMGQIVLPPPTSGFKTDTVVLTFNLGEVNSHPDSFFDQMVAASSVGPNFKAFNMRFWEGSLSAFSGLPRPTFYFRNSATWRRGYTLDPLTSSGTLHSGVFILPSSMPDCDMLIKAKDPEVVFVSGNFKEPEICHFLYVRGIFPSGNYPLGTYGGLGLKTFTFKFSYDWTSIDAHVIDPEDLCDHLLFTPHPTPSSFLGVGVSGHYRLNEGSPRLSVVSGFPGVNMTMVEFAGSPGALSTNSVGFGSGIIASGINPSGRAAHFTGTSHLQTQTTDCATLDFSHDSPDGPVSFCIAGWMNFDRTDVDHGILGRYHDAGITQRHQLRFRLSLSSKRFVWEALSRNSFECPLRYNIFNKLMGDPRANRWYFFVVGYDVDTNQMFMRINDLPIDSRQLTDRDAGIRNPGGGTPFALGAGNTKSISGTPLRMVGLLDSITFWRNRIPTNQELIDLYNKGRGLEFPFPPLRPFDFTQPPPPEVDPNPYLKGALTAHFSLNRPSGSTIWPNDAAGSGFDVVKSFNGPAGTVGATSGIIGDMRVVGASGAAFFSRSQPFGSGFLRSTNNAATKMEPEHPFTIAVWVRLHNLTSNHGICGIWRDVSANNRHWLIRFIQSSQKFGFQMANGAAAGAPSELLSSSDITLQANRWYLIVIRYDPNLSADQLEMIIDNEHTSQLTTTFVYNTTTPPEVFTIGAYNTASATPTYSDIDVDAVTTWRRKITDKEMKVYYNNGDGLEWSNM